MICVDASLAAKWVLREGYSAESRALYRAATRLGEQIVAPPFLPVEVTNVLRQRMRRQPPISLALATQLLRQFLASPVDLRNPPELHELALTLADAHGLPAAYDAHYVALAQLLACNFWTADERLFNTLKQSLPFVKWIGDYAPGAPL
jgi:predicted nucleic acid-binding protein